MGMEDTWYDYYRGPTSSSASTFVEKLTPQATNVGPPMHSTPMSPALSTLSGTTHAASEHFVSLAHHTYDAEKDRKAKIKASHARERQLVTIVLELLCQVAGFTCAIVFGIWAVKSYNVSVVALRVQTVANQLSLRAMCVEFPEFATSEKCRTLLNSNVDALWDANLLGEATEGTQIQMPKLSLGAIVGIVIGSVAGFLIFNIIFAIWRRRRMIMQLHRHVGTDYLSNLEDGTGGGSAAHHNFNNLKPPVQVSLGDKKNCQKSVADQVSSLASRSAPINYSGNPLAPIASAKKKNWIQPSHVLFAY